MNDKLNQVLKRQKKQISSPDEQNGDEIVQLVGFIVGEEEYAIPILNIKEIIKPSVIPLIDLRKRFSLSATKQSPSTRYIVLKDEESVAGFVIDRLTEAIRIDKRRIDAPPETLLKEKGMIYGIGKREQNILTILKVESLLKRDF